MGHAYVGLSRVFTSASIAMYTTQEKVLDGAVTMVNVVYPEMLTDHDRSIAKEHSSNKVTYDMSHLDETTRSIFTLDDVFVRYKQRKTTASEQVERLVSRSLAHRNELYKLSMGDYDNLPSHRI